jgi:uncharacterized membrane protein
MRHQLFLAVIVTSGVVLGGNHGAAQARLLAFFNIDVPGAVGTQPSGINSRGQIVGSYDDGQTTHGFLDDSGVFTTIDVPGALATQAAGINSRGQIVGSYGGNTDIPGGGFLYEDGVFTAIQVPFPGASGTEALGINPQGQIVGTYVDSDGFVRGFVDDAGVFTPVDVPFAGTFRTLPRGINSRGQIVGFYARREPPFGRFDFTIHGFLEQGGVFTAIEAPGGDCTHTGTTCTEANGINPQSQIVGFYVDDAQQEHGFIDDGGAFTTLDVPFPGAVGTAAHGINGRGHIVGEYLDSVGQLHGFLATPAP